MEVIHNSNKHTTPCSVDSHSISPPIFNDFECLKRFSTFGNYCSCNEPSKKIRRNRCSCGHYSTCEQCKCGFVCAKKIYSKFVIRKSCNK